MGELSATQEVLTKLSEAIRQSGNSSVEEACFRFNINEAGDPHLSVDVPGPDDIKFEIDGRTVLVISEELATKFAGRKLDVNSAGDFLLA